MKKEKGTRMKKLLLVVLCASMVLAIAGCKEKSTADKLKDAAQSAEKDASKALDDLTK